MGDPAGLVFTSTAPGILIWRMPGAFRRSDRFGNMKRPSLPTPHDLAQSMRSLSDRSDREAAILARSYIELCVEQVLVFHTAFEDAGAHRRLLDAIRDMDLRNKIELAAAVAKFPDFLADRLHAIRRIGNDFAHAWGDLAIGAGGYNVSEHITRPWSDSQFSEATGLGESQEGPLVDLDDQPIPDLARALVSGETGAVFFWIPTRPVDPLGDRESFNYAVWEAAYVLIVRSIGSWSGVERVSRQGTNDSVDQLSQRADGEN